MGERENVTEKTRIKTINELVFNTFAQTSANGLLTVATTPEKLEAEFGLDENYITRQYANNESSDELFATIINQALATVNWETVLNRLKATYCKGCDCFSHGDFLTDSAICENDFDVCEKEFFDDDGATDDGENCWDCGIPNEEANMNMCSECGHTLCWDCQGSHRNGRVDDGLPCGQTNRVF